MTIMKKILYKNALFFFAILFFSVQYTHAIEAPSALQRLKNTVNKFIIALYPAYFASDEEKKAAQDTINNLLQERTILEEQLKNNTLSLKQKVILRKEINEINNDIDAQKIITGEKMSLVQKTLIGLGISSTIIMPISFYVLFKQLQQPAQPPIQPPTPQPQRPPTQPQRPPIQPAQPIQPKLTEQDEGILIGAWASTQNTGLETLKKNIKKIKEKSKIIYDSLENIKKESNYQSLNTEYKKAEQDYDQLESLWAKLTLAKIKRKITQKDLNAELKKAHLINQDIITIFNNIRDTIISTQ